MATVVGLVMAIAILVFLFAAALVIVWARVEGGSFRRSALHRCVGLRQAREQNGALGRLILNSGIGFLMSGSVYVESNTLGGKL